MAGLLAGAGATDVQTSSRRVEFAFESFEQWLRFSRSVGQRVAWERMSDAETSRVLDETRTTFEDAAGADGAVRVWQEVRFTVGHP
jgi:hypothetical protein